MNPAAALLPALLAIPVLGAILVMLIPRGEDNLARGVGLGFALLSFVVSLAILGPFDSSISTPQMVFDKAWIEILGTRFKLGVDGLSIWMVILTTFLTPIVLLSTHTAITKRVREFVAIMLILEAGMLGAFLALDLFLFYIFWEVMLIPMYLLIGIWGGQRRIYASIKFVIYTMVGSLLMLVAIFYLYSQYQGFTGEASTVLSDLDRMLLPRDVQIYCFLAFALAFAIKVPLFPLHTWLPDAHVEAPTAGSVVLAGVLLKFGIYGFLRFAIPLFPYGAATLAPYLMGLAVAGIIYGAFVAFAQDDVKKLVAYSSVSHLGFCMLGVFAMTLQGIEGSIYAMISHGLTTSGLFLAIGIIYERRHTRRLSEFGGLWAKMPIFGAMFLICVLGSVGLPGLSGFVGEFLTIIGTFIAGPGFDGGTTFPNGWPNYIPSPKILAALATTGVIFGAVYLLYMFQKVMFGPITNKENEKLKDLTKREVVVFIPIVAMIVVMGVFPRPFLKTMEKTVDNLISNFKAELAQPDGLTVKGATKRLDEAKTPRPRRGSPTKASPKTRPGRKTPTLGRGVPSGKVAPGHEGHDHAKQPHRPTRPNNQRNSATPTAEQLQQLIKPPPPPQPQRAGGQQ